VLWACDRKGQALVLSEGKFWSFATLVVVDFGVRNEGVGEKACFRFLK
jgi:hypothetical protein